MIKMRLDIASPLHDQRVRMCTHVVRMCTHVMPMSYACAHTQEALYWALGAVTSNQLTKPVVSGGTILGARRRVPRVHDRGCLLVRHVAETTGLVSWFLRLASWLLRFVLFVCLLVGCCV
jgi:hypothetical protein